MLGELTAAILSNYSPADSKTDTNCVREYACYWVANCIHCDSHLKWLNLISNYH